MHSYETTVEVKGGFRQFRGRNIIITSPKHPKDWYKDDGSDRVEQLLDRIDKIKHYAGESKRRKKDHGVKRKTEEEIEKEMEGEGWNPFESGFA